MAHPLEKKIERLRVRLWLLAVTRAAGWLVAAVLGAVILFAAIDYSIRFTDTGIRLICSLAIPAVVMWVCYRFCYCDFFNRGRRQRLSSVQLAQRVEKIFPQLGDSLASSIDFLQKSPDDPRAGSAALRRAVVAETTTQSEGLNFNDCSDARPALRAVVTAAVMCLLAATIAIVNPVLARVAITRLAFPLSNVTWPQKTHLKLVDRIERVAEGGLFEVEVTDAYGARLPTDAKIFYRLYEPDGSTRQQSESMHHLGHVLRAMRENVVSPFAYRVTGGDDQSMSWTEVAVFEPPTVESLSVRLTPPDYTHWPTVTIDEGQAAGFRVLSGNRLRMQASLNKPIKSVQMHFGNQPAIPGRVGKDGMQFVVPIPKKDDSGFTVERSGAFWFEMTDRQGLRGGDDLRWDIRVVEDRPPSVSIVRPSATVYATADATVPIAVSVKDDLAVHRVELIARLSGRQAEGDASTDTREEQKIVLYERPFQCAQSRKPSENEESPASRSVDRTILSDNSLWSQGQGETRSIQYGWQLDSVNIGDQRLRPGSKVKFHVTAEDYKPLQGESGERTLIVVTPDEMLERIAARHQFILAELAQVTAMQRKNRCQVSALLAHLKETDRLGAGDLDRLRAVELAQRQTAEALAGLDDSVASRMRQLLNSLRNNRLDNGTVSRRMDDMLAEIERLRKTNLTVIAGELTTALKSAEAIEDENEPQSSIDADSAAHVINALRIVETNQLQVVASLEQLLGRMSQWDDYRRFHRNVGQLVREQADLLHRATELGHTTLAKSPADLQPKESTALQTAAYDQSELARRLDRITYAMTQMSQKLATNDSQAAATLRDAVDYVARHGVAAHMRTAQDSLAQNRIIQATSQQRQVLEDLRAILDILAGRRDSSQTAQGQSQETADQRRENGPPSQRSQDKKSAAGRLPGESIAGSDVEQPNAGRADAESIDVIIKRIWGELPERDRQRLMQYPVEQFLPGYERMIEEYYKRLSEEDISL